MLSFGQLKVNMHILQFWFITGEKYKEKKIFMLKWRLIAVWFFSCFVMGNIIPFIKNYLSVWADVFTYHKSRSL